MKIYVAGWYGAKDRLGGERARLEALGHTVVSSWLDEPPGPSLVEGVVGQRHAFRDCVEIACAGLFILDTLDESKTGGREVEFGYALRHPMEFWLVGPVRNIFHNLVSRRFATWDEVIAAAKDVR